MLRFKSPRECYKQKPHNISLRLLYLVSSPQGNATNSTMFLLRPKSFLLVSSPQGNATNHMRKAIYISRISVCFKSPRECYKLLSLERMRISSYSFKSPRECYKLFLLLLLLLVLLRFKSPRECYKRSSQHGIPTLSHMVSSPQGNATNHSRPRGIPQGLRCFKSPRECYKHLTRNPLFCYT